MKRIMIILLSLYCFCANGATVCARDNNVVIGLAPKAPTSVSYDNGSYEWRVFYNGFGTVSGISSCISLDSDTTKCPNIVNGVFSQYAGCPYAKNGADTNANFQGRDDGNRCWCKIIHPFESKWVNIWTYSNKCNETCAKYCASDGMKDNYNNFRVSILATVGMDE